MMLPEGTFRCIVADPPWPYRDKLGSGKAESKQGMYAGVGGAHWHYPLLRLVEILALPVEGLIHPDGAHLYLWVPGAFMREGHEVAKAWGFTVKQVLVWWKRQMGMGFYWRNNCEFVLFGVAGKLRTLRHDLTTGFMADRTRHSEKPFVFYERVVQMSPGPYVDLFARQPREGWVCWGDELDSPEQRFDKLKAASSSPGHQGRAAGQALYTWLRRNQMHLSFVLPAGAVVEIKDVTGPAVTKPLTRKLVVSGDTFRELRRGLDGAWQVAFVVPVGAGERWQVLKASLQDTSIL